MDWDKIKNTIDHTLKDYGVDWKLNDPKYYEALKEELIIGLKKVI